MDRQQLSWVFACRSHSSPPRPARVTQVCEGVTCHSLTLKRLAALPPSQPLCLRSWRGSARTRPQLAAAASECLEGGMLAVLRHARCGHGGDALPHCPLRQSCSSASEQARGSKVMRSSPWLQACGRSCDGGHPLDDGHGGKPHAEGGIPRQVHRSEGVCSRDTGRRVAAAGGSCRMICAGNGKLVIARVKRLRYGIGLCWMRLNPGSPRVESPELGIAWHMLQSGFKDVLQACVCIAVVHQ